MLDGITITSNCYFKNVTVCKKYYFSTLIKQQTLERIITVEVQSSPLACNCSVSEQKVVVIQRLLQLEGIRVNMTWQQWHIHKCSLHTTVVDKITLYAVITSNSVLPYVAQAQHFWSYCTHSCVLSDMTHELYTTISLSHTHHLALAWNLRAGNNFIPLPNPHGSKVGQALIQSRRTYKQVQCTQTLVYEINHRESNECKCSNTKED